MIKYKIASLLGYLREIGVLGALEDRSKLHLIRSSTDFAYLRYDAVDYPFMCVVKRSSIQRYWLAWWSMRLPELKRVSFRNYRLTGDYIKNLIRR